MIKSLACVALVVLTAHLALATTYYVSNAGTDGGPGSGATPFATLDHAAQVVGPGDWVEVLPGTYTGFLMDHGGTADSRITFHAEPGAVINKNNPHYGGDGIRLEGASYISVEGFTITGCTSAGIRSGNNIGVIARNNNCDANGTWGIFSGHSEGFVIENNVCSRSGTQHGIYFSNSADNPIIRGNVCWGNYSCGIQINADVSMGGDGITTGALIENNIIYDNGTAGGAAINLDGVQSSIIRNNLLYNNRGSGLVMYKGDGAAGPLNNLVENNTIVQATTGRWAVSIGSNLGGNTIRNNIIYHPSASKGSIKIDTAAGLTSDNNIVVNRMTYDGEASVVTLSSWQGATGQDTNSLLATLDQIFVDATNNDYHLRPGSVAINAGGTVAATMDLAGNPRVVGGIVDIGAYEFLNGDINYDGKVSFADYLILEANFGKSGKWTQGDLTLDGKVSFADYLVLEANFGKSAPEPASLCLLGLGGVMMLRRKRH